MITDSLFESIVFGSDGFLAALGAVDLYFIVGREDNGEERMGSLL